MMGASIIGLECSISFPLHDCHAISQPFAGDQNINIDHVPLSRISIEPREKICGTLHENRRYGSLIKEACDKYGFFANGIVAFPVQRGHTVEIVNDGSWDYLNQTFASERTCNSGGDEV